MERPSQTTTNTAFASALKMLQRREHSAHELIQKLTRHGFSTSCIHEGLARLQKENLQSDARFSEQYIASRSRRGYGPIRIIKELVTKGIDRDLIDRCLETAQIDWQSHAMGVRVKRFGPSLPGDYPTRAKQLRFMENRGFGQQLKALFNEEE